MSLSRGLQEQGLYLLRVVGLAAAYYFLGKLGLMLAVPPGYATVIWPPSGIALAAVLAYKPRVWPGIFLGSIILNAQIAGAYSPEAGWVLAKLGAAACIAVGSTLQALLTRELIRSFFGLPMAMRDWRDVVGLAAVAGPLGCLTAATIGVSTLFATGSIAIQDIISNGLTWWKGDTLGVLVFMPMALMLPGSALRIRFRDYHVRPLPTSAILALLIPLSLTLYAMQAMIQFNYDKNAAQFQALAEEGKKALVHRMESFTQALSGGAGFLLGSSYVTRDEWRLYTRNLDVRKNYAGMNGMGWILDVKESDLESFVKKLHAEGAVDFHIFPRLAHAPYFIISYIEPEEPNRPSLGLNIAFEARRLEAAERARDSGRPTITQRIQLVQDRSGDAGFLLLVPLYEPNWPVRTLAERRAAFRGWVFAPLLGKGFLTDLTHSLGNTLNVRLYDQEEAPANLIYSSAPAGPKQSTVFQVRETVEVGQKNWLLVWDSTPAFEQNSARYEPLLVLAGGLLLTGLFGGFLMVVTRRAETIQQLVWDRTHQLQRSQEALKSSEETFRNAMEHAPIGMALVDPSGRFLTVNQALCVLLGYDYAELCRLDIQSITHPEDLSADLQIARDTLEGQRDSYEMEKRYIAKDGRVIWTLLRATLVRATNGTPRYFISQMQDITQRKQVDLMKSEFISTVSHELRTPLTSIRGSLGLVASGVFGQLPEKLTSLIRIAHNNSERLVRIINDILDIEKIESGKIELNIHPVLLASTLRQSIEVNEAYGAKFNVKFVLESVPA